MRKQYAGRKIKVLLKNGQMKTDISSTESHRTMNNPHW